MAVFNLKDVVTPKHGLVVYTDAYWLCSEGQPSKALFYGDYPQANRNRKIVEWSLNTKQYAERGDLKIVYIETAYVPERH